VVERRVEADGELVQFEVDAHFEELGAGAELPGGALKRARHIRASAQGVGAVWVRVDRAVDEAARLSLPMLWNEWLVAILFHDRLPWQNWSKYRPGGAT